MTATHRPYSARGTSARELPCDAPCPPQDRPYVLAATVTASAMAFIDGTVVHVALPAIQAEFGTSFAGLQWIVNLYLLMLGALLLAGGALGDQVGRRRIFMLGIALFAAASILCAAAPTSATLITARAVQGLGAALMVPQSLAIIAASFPRATRGRAIGTWAGFSALTTALGPPLGGLLIDLLSWRAAFWINLPLAAVSLWLTWRHVPESRSSRPEPVDWAGAATATLGLGLVTYALTMWPRIDDGGYATVIAAAIGGCALLAAFVAIERRVTAPMMPPALLADRTFAGLNAMTLLLYAALGGTLFLLPYNLIQLHHYSATAAGLAMLPLGLTIGILSRYSGRLMDRIGPRIQLVAGPLLVALGCSGLALPGLQGGYAVTFLVPVALLGLGMATAISPLTTSIMNAVHEDRSGAASGINNAASRIAGLLAVAVVGAVATAVFTLALGDALQPLGLPHAALQQLMAHADRLAEVPVPAGLDAAARASAQAGIDRAFLEAFRVSTLLHAACAAGAALIATRMFLPSPAAAREAAG